MPENPWGRPDNGETRQWVPANPHGTTAPVGTGQTGPGGPQRSGGGNGGLIIAIIAAVLAVALLAGVLIWLFSSGGDDSDDNASPTVPQFSGAPTTTETVTEAPTPAPEPEQPEPTAAVPDSGSNGSSNGSNGNGGSSSGSSDSGSDSSGSGSSWRDAGLNYNGWSGYSNATCNGSDTWVYAGGNDSTKVVICRATARDGSSLGLYYRGHAGGQGLERDVDMSSADIADGYFEIPANPAKFIIDGDEMKVYENGSLKKTHSFGQWWYDTGA